MNHHLAILLLLTLSLSCCESAQAAESDPIMRWQFDSKHVSKELLTATAGTLNGKLVGEVQFSKQDPVSAILNKKKSTKQYILAAPDIADVNLPKESITVSAWVQVNELQEWGGIVGALQDNGSFERGWLLGFRQDRFCFAVAGDTKKRLTYLTSKTSFEPGYWYHVVGTYDGITMQLFVDGRMQGESKEQSGQIVYPEHAPFTLGAYKDDNELYPLRGQIERVSIWGQSLSADEVTKIYQKRKSLFPDIDETLPTVVGWPTYKRDIQRSGVLKLWGITGLLSK